MPKIQGYLFLSKFCDITLYRKFYFFFLVIFFGRFGILFWLHPKTSLGMSEMRERTRFSSGRLKRILGDFLGTSFPFAPLVEGASLPAQDEEEQSKMSQTIKTIILTDTNYNSGGIEKILMVTTAFKFSLTEANVFDSFIRPVFLR